MKKYHISDNDLDGVSALDLSELAFGEEVTTVASTTRTIDPMVQDFVENQWDKDTLLIITDLSIDSRELADAIDEKVKEGYQIVLIDHHPTAFWLNDYSWATVVNVENGVKTSATTMYLDYLNQNHDFINTQMILDYTQLVREYDTWDWFYVGIEVNGVKQPNYRSKRLNDLLYIIGEKKFRHMVVEKLSDPRHCNFLFSLSEKDEYVLDVEQYRIEAYIKQKKEEMKVIPFTLNDREYQVAVMTTERYHSELGNAICRDFEHVDFVAMSEVGRMKISFRASKSDVDTSVVAKHFGGGGHAPASGCGLNGTTMPIFLQPLLETSKN